jgi:threonine aldolase
MYARMHFVHIEGFTQGSDLFSVHSAKNLSTCYPAFVFMSRYFHMYGRHVKKQGLLSST